MARIATGDAPFPKGVKVPDDLSAGPLVYVITPGYMRAMGTGIRGRDFTWDDTPKSTNVVMINRNYARFLANYANWPGGSAVGQLLASGKQDLLVVGVVDDVHEEGTEGDAGWQIYYPVTQNFPNAAQLVIRTTLPPASMATSVITALRELNPKQPAAEFRPIQALVDHANSSRQFFMLLVATFASLGLLLASLGIYGVISYSVTQRTQEIGIRMALGATMAQVQRSVIAKTLRLALTGIAVGADCVFAGLPGHRRIAFQHRTQRPHHVCRHGLANWHHCSARRLYPCEESLTHQPHDCRSQQLIDSKCHESPSRQGAQKFSSVWLDDDSHRISQGSLSGGRI